MRDECRETALKAGLERKVRYDCKCVVRSFLPDDLVWLRSRAMDAELDASWLGLYKIKRKISEVNYELDVRKKEMKVVHIYKVKKFVERDERVLRVVVVAEDVNREDTRMVVLTEDSGYVEADVAKLKEELTEAFSSFLVKTDMCKLVINTGDALPVSLAPYRLPDKWKESVQQEIDQ